MDCLIGSGLCPVKRELLHWKRTAHYFAALAMVNFIAAWAIALCKATGGVH